MLANSFANFANLCFIYFFGLLFFEIVDCFCFACCYSLSCLPTVFNKFVLHLFAFFLVKSYIFDNVYKVFHFVFDRVFQKNNLLAQTCFLVGLFFFLSGWVCYHKKNKRAITNLPVYKIFNDSRVLTELILQMIASIHQAHSPIAPELISDKKYMVLETSKNGRARNSSKWTAFCKQIEDLVKWWFVCFCNWFCKKYSCKGLSLQALYMVDDTVHSSTNK